MSTLRDEIAAAIGAHRNGPASDGQGWYRNDQQRAEIYAETDAILARILRGGRLIHNGRAYPVTETDWKDGNDEYQEYTVYTAPEAEPDAVACICDEAPHAIYCPMSEDEA